MTQQGYGFPFYQLDILETSGRKTPFSERLYQRIESVEVEQVWDGADQLTLMMRAWDEYAADFDIVGQRVLEPGTDVILRAGYGDEAPTVMGRYTIVEHEPSFSEGVPVLAIRAYDGFAKFMDNTFPGDYGGAADGITSYTDVTKIMARKYGMGFAGDEAPAIRWKTKTKRVRKRVNGKVVRKNGKVVRTSRKVNSRVIKNAGDTDAKMLKDMANYSGFLVPKVRYLERSRLVNGTNIIDPGKLHAVTENTRDRDVLFFRRADIRRQKVEAGAFQFWYARRSGAPASLKAFDPTWNTDNVPIAVRVVGVVKETVGDGRKRRVRKRIHVVEAQLTDPEQLRIRSNLLRQAAREKNPRKAQELRDKAALIEPSISVTRETKTRLTKQDKKRFKNVGTAMIEVLDRDRRPSVEYNRLERKKTQSMRRETIGRTVVVTDGAELRNLAKGWLAARLQLHMNATAVVENIPKIERLYPNQIHQFSGLPPEYEGPYMIRTATHVWSGGNGHTVNLNLQRVAETPTAMAAAESTED